MLIILCTLLHYIGAVNQCDTEHNIKVYLIVQWSFNLVHMMMCTLTACTIEKDMEGCLSPICLSCCNLILILFLIAWTIAGSVWVWRSLDDWQSDHSACNSAMFVSATICVSPHYVVLLLICCCCAYSIWQLCNSESIRGWTEMSTLETTIWSIPYTHTSM